jgi:hypothetical protein
MYDGPLSHQKRSAAPTGNLHNSQTNILKVATKQTDSEMSSFTVALPQTANLAMV